MFERLQNFMEMVSAIVAIVVFLLTGSFGKE